MKIVDLQVSWQKDFVFKINPATLELGYLWITDIEQKTKNYIWDNNEWSEIQRVFKFLAGRINIKINFI